MTEISIDVHEFNAAITYLQDKELETTQDNIDAFFNGLENDPEAKSIFYKWVEIERDCHSTALRSHFAKMTDEEREKWHKDYDIMSRIVLSIFGVIGLAVGSLLLISFVNRALNSFGWGVLI